MIGFAHAKKMTEVIISIKFLYSALLSRKEKKNGQRQQSKKKTIDLNSSIFISPFD